jgi:hypothetical protein
MLPVTGDPPAVTIPIYRAPMRSRALELPPGTGAEYGLGHGVVAIDPGPGEKAARSMHRFATLPEGVFVWTRDRDGAYHLGRITGPIREANTASARRSGVRYVRPTDWLELSFSPDQVPAAVAATFARGGRNFQRTHDAEAERLTEELWHASRSAQASTHR